MIRTELSPEELSAATFAYPLSPIAAARLGHRD